MKLTDACIKNGGDPFLAEVASREFIDNLVSIMKMPSVNNNVKTKALRLIQNWATAFEGKPSLGYVGQVYKNLKGEGESGLIVEVTFVLNTTLVNQGSRSHLRMLWQPTQQW